MPRHLDALPGVEIGEDLAAGLGDLFLDRLDFALEVHVHRVFLGVALQVFELVFQLDDRLFKVQLMFHR
jgi:hypothetical protein